MDWFNLLMWTVFIGLVIFVARWAHRRFLRPKGRTMTSRDLARPTSRPIWGAGGVPLRPPADPAPRAPKPSAKDGGVGRR